MTATMLTNKHSRPREINLKYFSHGERKKKRKKERERREGRGKGERERKIFWKKGQKMESPLLKKEEKKRKEKRIKNKKIKKNKNKE